MKKGLLFLLAIIIYSSYGWTQNQFLPNSFTINGKVITPESNVTQMKQTYSLKQKNLPASAIKQQFIIQFDAIPTLEEQAQLDKMGIKLLNYISNNAYFATIEPAFYSSSTTFKKLHSIVEIKPEYKIDKLIADGTIPDYATDKPGYVKVVVTYFDQTTTPQINSDLKSVRSSNVNVLDKFHQVVTTVALTDINKLASLGWVQNIELVAPPSAPYNNHGRTLHRANVLNSTIRGLGYGLTGKGVSIGLWDCDVTQNRDFNGRVTNREFEYHISDHGTHTCGTMVSAGLLDPTAVGMAPDAKVYAWNFNTQSDGLNEAQERLISLTNGDDIEITSNSWGYTVSACPEPYAYNSSDHNEDLVASWYPYFLYCFSAGNDQAICPGGYATTSKNMKNSLMVAAIDQMDVMSSFSSFGPSKDGRLIPNIAADGVNVYSDFFDNTYGIMSGTSMACPGTAGTAALIYGRYKDTHGNVKPTSAFMRALICNTATDLGNPGPDYKFGYGEINGFKAVKVMEQNTYFNGTLSQGQSTTQTITVPAGASSLKVFLAWTDLTGTPGAAKILVNDLDLTVTNNGTVYQPWILDPANPANNAVRGADHMNNMEQVTVSNPAAGTYTITINGTTIPSGTQDFSVVYEWDMPMLALTSPIGGEYYSPNAQVVVRWDCEGYTSPFMLEYSTDDGLNYTTIATNIASNLRSYLWTVPTTVTGKAKVRISNGYVLDISRADFNIMSVPQSVAIGKATCSGAGPFTLQWTAIPGATYQVFKVTGQTYNQIGTSATNSYIISGLTQNNDNWFCVRAVDIATGAVSERSLGVNVNPALPVTALPFSESFATFNSSNFYFSSNLGSAGIHYINDAQKYAIRLEGASVSTSWVTSSSTTAFTNNPNFITKASLCSVDLTKATGSIRLKYDYLMKYTAANYSFYRVKVNGTVLTSLTGTSVYAATTTGTVNYQTVYYDLSAYAGQVVTLDFEAVCKTPYVTYVVASTGDYDFSTDTNDHGDFVAIDNVQIALAPIDLTLTTLTTPTGVTNAESIKIAIINNSAISLTNIPVSYQINTNAPVNEVIAGPVAPFVTTNYTFTQKANLSVAGLYTIVASVNYTGDAVAANNSQSVQVANNGTDVVMGVAASPYTTCSATIVSPGGRYLGYPISSNKNLTLAPATAGNNMSLSFSSYDTELGYDSLTVYSGTAATAANMLGHWTGQTIPPTVTSFALGGQLYLIFKSDASVNGMGFVANASCVPKGIDAGVTAITSPATSGTVTGLENVTITVSNPGLNPISAIPVYYQLGTNTAVSETMPGPIVSGATANYTFTTKVDLSVAGSYSLKAWVALPNDAVAANNSLTASITRTAVVVPTTDAGISAITTIYPKRLSTTLSTIAATVKNYGTVSIVNPTCAYKVNGTLIQTQNYSGTIAANGTGTITFTTKADLSTPSTTYTIDVYTTVAGDANAANDHFTTTVVTPTNSATNVVATLDGVDDNVVAPATTANNLTNNFTVEAWANLKDVGVYGRIFDKANILLYYFTSYGTSVYGQPNSYVLSITSTTAGTSTVYWLPQAVQLGAWNHYAVTVSSSNVYTFYINGVAQPMLQYSYGGVVGATGTPGPVNSNAANPLYIGCSATASRVLTGNIDEFRVWNTTLSQTTIQSNMMTNYVGNEANLIAYYKFIEGSGNYVYDYTANDNTALITNANTTNTGANQLWNSPGTLLTSFSVAGQSYPTTFNATTNTYTVVMSTTANLTNLVPTFTVAENSTVQIGLATQTSGVTANNFSAGSLTYTVLGTGFNTGITQTYNVVVKNDLSTACDITAYSFELADNTGLTSRIALVRNGSNYSAKVASGTNVSALKAQFTASAGASVYINGVLQTSPQATTFNYANPILVTVVAANGLVSKNFAVSIDTRSSLSALTAFSINTNQVQNTRIDPVAHAIYISLKLGSDLTDQIAAFTISPNAKMYIGCVAQFSSITGNNYTSPVVYSVVSEDGTTSVDWTVYVTILTTWRGTSWDAGVPNGTVNAVIAANYTSTANIVCSNLTVNAGITLNVAAGSYVTVNGDLANSGTVLLKATTNATPTGSLIVYGNETGNLSSQLWLSGNSTHYISSPVTNATTSVFTGSPVIKSYMASNGTWNPATGNYSGVLTQGKGYSVVYTTPTTVTFTGAPKNGNFDFYSGLLYNVASIADNGGNPYTSAIDWNALYALSTTKNICPTISYRTSNLQIGNYCATTGASTNGGQRYIPAMQGFSIRPMTTATAVLTATNAVRVHATTVNYMKSDNIVDNSLKLTASGGNVIGDETMIMFRPDATTGFDNLFDGEKTFVPENNFCHLYSRSSDGFNLAINTLPQTQSIDLYFRAGLSGNYKIDLTNMNLFNYSTVVLEDVVAGTFNNITTGSYNFAYKTGSEKPFRLHFGDNNTALNNNTAATLQVYSAGKFVYVNNPNAEQVTVSIYDLSGKKIYENKTGFGLQRIAVNAVNGMYLVKVSGNSKMTTAKVMIQ